MPYEAKPGDLSVFKNDRKEKDTHPDYRIVGTGLDGQKIKGALWLKKDRNGKTYMSGKIEPDTFQSDRGGDEGSRSGGGQSVSGDRRDYPMDDQIPF